MHFVPIPATIGDLNASRRHWLPFLPHITKRSKETIAQLIERIASGRTQIALVWDGEKAHALIGMQYVKRGDELVGEIVWLTGYRMKEWTHLLPEMERYLREHMGCKIIRPYCRPGWRRLIEKRGYKLTHCVMEKNL